jgi:perosamine synthetase
MNRSRGNDLAVSGGRPVRAVLLPYVRQCIEDDDVAAVVDVLRSDWLTTGPVLRQFEETLAASVQAHYAVAVNSGTAALHCLVHALGVGPGDEVIVPAITFCSTANVVVHAGATPVFADVDPETLLVDPQSVMERLTPNTRAVVAVDYAGQPCDYPGLRQVVEGSGAVVVADGCHALGAKADGRPVGSLAKATAFSFHAVKHVAMGEGGAITTDDLAFAETARRFRNHGIDSDHLQRARSGSWAYDMVDLGLNYRMPDILAALGLTQLAKQPAWLARRRQIAALYDAALADVDGITPLTRRAGVEHAYHLYVVQMDTARWSVGRAEVFAALRAEGIGVNVHYVPVHLHSYYRRRFGYGPGLCPRAESAYERLLTLPMFPAMSDEDVADVVAALRKVSVAYVE